MKHLLALLALLLTSAVATAQDRFSYTYIEGGYTEISFDGQDSNMTGYALEGSLALLDHVHAFATWQDGDLDLSDQRNLERRTLTVGGGINMDLFPLVDVQGRAGYVAQRLDDGTGLLTEEGFAWEARARVRAHKHLEVQGAYGALEVGKFAADSYWEGKALLWVHENVALTGSWREYEEEGSQTLLVGLRVAR